MPGHGLFSDATLNALENAGWTPEREIDISSWMRELSQQGYQCNSAVAVALRSFGGLCLEPVNREGPNFSNDEPLNVDPILAGSGHLALADELRREIGGDWFPFAEWLSYSSVFVERSGWVVATGLGLIWELGSSVNDAVEFALLAHRPLRCIKVLDGGKPYPSNPE